jgi:hypothetical protein
LEPVILEWPLEIILGLGLAGGTRLFTGADCGAGEDLGWDTGIGTLNMESVLGVGGGHTSGSLSIGENSKRCGVYFFLEDPGRVDSGEKDVLVGVVATAADPGFSL